MTKSQKRAAYGPWPEALKENPCRPMQVNRPALPVASPLAGQSSGRVDLHTHSSASDGALSPAALVKAGVAAGLKAMALTDHDTLEGLPEFKAAGAACGLRTIGGVEISLEHSGTMHLLGLNVNDTNDNPGYLKKLKTFRVERNLRMLDSLGRLGYYLSWDKLLETSGGGQMGRPHFAALMVKKGYFKTREEVFEKLLAKGRPAYVDKKRLPPREGVVMLRESGWAPVLAHPLSLGLSADQWPDQLKLLRGWGLIGLEVIHPSHNFDQVDFFLELAERFDLVPTVGSDFHGYDKPAAGLGWAIANTARGWEMVDNLRSRL